MSAARQRALGYSVWATLAAALALTVWAGDAPGPRWAGGRVAVTETLIVECVSISSGGTIVSPDGKHVAYVIGAEEGLEMAGEDDSGSLRYESVSDLVFNPDSQRLAHVATIYEDGEYLDTIVGGLREKAAVYADIRGLQFSPDGKRMAYVAQPQGRRGHEEQWFLVLDGKEGKKHDAILEVLFSPDSRRTAYVAAHNAAKTQGVVVDGQEDRRYDEVRWLEFSPDSKHVAYWGRRGGTWCRVADGEETKTQDCHGWPPVFSPDGRRVAYVVKQPAGEVVVVDGQKGNAYGRIGWRGFSPDGQRVACEAHRGKQQFVVMNGQEGTAYDEVSVLGGFSPDSKRFAYCARRGKTWRVVVDGREGKPCQAVSSFTFSPDSRHFAYDAKGEKAHVLVVDGEELAEYTEILSRHVPMAFIAPSQLRLFAMRGKKALRVGVALGAE